MSHATITIYLCKTKPPAITPTPLSAAVNKEISLSFDKDGNAVGDIPLEVKGGADCLEPVTNVPIEAEIIPASRLGDLAECLWGGDTELTWERGFFIDQQGVFMALHSFISIQYPNPHDRCARCFWLSTTVYAHNPREMDARYPFIVRYFREASSGMIPESGDPEDYWLGNPPAVKTHAEEQPNVYPGENLEVVWDMIINGSEYLSVIDVIRFETPCFTGGIIEEIFVDSAGLGPTMDITLHGTTYRIEPTDYADYQVGSWVYILKQGVSGANVIARETEYLPTTGVEEGWYRAVPVTFGGDLVNLGTSTTQDYQMEDMSGFEVAHHFGVITKLDTTDNKADVEVDIIRGDGSTETVEYKDVNIVFHCQFDLGTDPGYTAFDEGSEVVLLNADGTKRNPSASDLTIIGLKGSLGMCTTRYLRFTFEKNMMDDLPGEIDPQEGIRRHVYWDVMGNKPAKIFNEDGDLFDGPYTDEDIEFFESIENFVVISTSILTGHEDIYTINQEEYYADECEGSYYDKFSWSYDSNGNLIDRKLQIAGGGDHFLYNSTKGYGATDPDSGVPFFIGVEKTELATSGDRSGVNNTTFRMLAHWGEKEFEHVATWSSEFADPTVRIYGGYWDNGWNYCTVDYMGYHRTKPIAGGYEDADFQFVCLIQMLVPEQTYNEDAVLPNNYPCEMHVMMMTDTDSQEVRDAKVPYDGQQEINSELTDYVQNFINEVLATGPELRPAYHGASEQGIPSQGANMYLSIRRSSG